MEIVRTGNYAEAYGTIYDSQKAATESQKNKEVNARKDGQNTENNQAYLKKIQQQVPYVKLETGYGLSMKRDKRAGVITVNPKFLEKMQNDPEAEKKYTQTLKDIEKAERTANAYYNSLGGCVERTSHWYVDENGEYQHFAYTRRDDRLNKKIREETQKNKEKFIEKTRKKAAEKKKKLEENLDEKAEEIKKAEKEAEAGEGKKSEIQPEERAEADPRVSLDFKI